MHGATMRFMIKGKLLWVFFWSILQPSLCILPVLTYFLVCDCGLWKFVGNLISYCELTIFFSHTHGVLQSSVCAITNTLFVAVLCGSIK